MREKGLREIVKRDQNFYKEKIKEKKFREGVDFKKKNA